MNIILICLDSFRADCLGARGLNPVVKTPNLDRLVAEGVLFENAFGEAQPTIPFRRTLCTGMRGFPFNRRCDVTGLWPTLAGWHKIPPEQPTLAELLLDHGYVTGLCVSAYHTLKATCNFTRGFTAWDFIRGHEADSWRMGSLDRVDLDKWWSDEIAPPGGQPSAAFIQYLLNNHDREHPERPIPERLFDSAIRFVESNRANAPFFLSIDSFSPHEPWDPPREYADAYDPDWDEPWLPIRCFNIEAPERIRRRVWAQYHGELTHLDFQIGRLLDKLDDLKLADDTLLMVVSDHGAELWDHGEIRKTIHGARYRHNAEILCLMRFPRREHAGRRVKGFMLSHDFVPTLLDLVGAGRPPMDGENFMPMVTGERESLRDHIVTGWANGAYSTRAMVRTMDHAYSCDSDVEDLNEYLFDVAADPGEMTNLATERPEITERHRALLREYLGQLPYRRTAWPPEYQVPFNAAPAARWGAQYEESRKGV